MDKMLVNGNVGYTEFSGVRMNGVVGYSLNNNTITIGYIDGTMQSVYGSNSAMKILATMADIAMRNFKDGVKSGSLATERLYA